MLRQINYKNVLSVKSVVAKITHYFFCFAAVLVAATSACVTTSHSKTDIVIRNFDGDNGQVVREAVESRMHQMKGYFRVIARDEGSLAAVQQEAVKGKNKDDIFTKEGTGVQLRQGLAGTKVLHGTCHENQDRHQRKVWNGWLLGAYYPNEYVIDHKLYCTYRLINAETHIQEFAGDTAPYSWTSTDSDLHADPEGIRLLADEIIASIKKLLEEGE